MRKKPLVHEAMLGEALLNIRSKRANSRSALARALGLSPSTLCIYVDHLIAKGYVVEIGLGLGIPGRPQRLLGLQGQSGWFCGIELNAQRMQIVAVDFAGRIISSTAYLLTADADAEVVMNKLISQVKKLITYQTTPLLGIGFGAPGLVDRQRGTGRYFSFIRNWNDIPIVEMLTKRFKTAVTLENNLRVTALAERWFGGGSDLKDYVILGPRSGFGMSIVHNGELLHGAHEVAGEVGLWSWPQPGGSRALHDTMSAVAIYRRMAKVAEDEHLPSNLSAALAEVADPESVEWKNCALDFARVIRTVQLIVDPEVFFLHGPLTVLGARFCSDIQSAAAGLLPQLPGMEIKIVPTSLGDDAGALGAASLAMESWCPAP